MERNSTADHDHCVDSQSNDHKRQNDETTNDQASHKRSKLDNEANDENRASKEDLQASPSGPPADGKTLGEYCNEKWTTTSLANYYAEPKVSQTSRDVFEYNKGDKLLYPPFFQTTTPDLVSRTDGSEFGFVGNVSESPSHTKDEQVTEFDVAVQYGRPLFARMHLKGELKQALGKILLRMKGGARDGSEDMHSLLVQEDYSLLATRLQIGHVPFGFASKLVETGYAHLIHFDPENTAAIEIAYLPDPVCAWLAMTQMIANCNLFETVNGIKMQSGHAPSVWSEKAIKIFSSGLCHPQKGGVGEVAAAFYMLACGDELRNEQSPNLTKLSVPLEKWITILKGQNGCKSTTENDNVVAEQSAGASVNFIQVCWNYLRHSLKEMQDGQLFKHWYLGGRALYAYASCPAYDMLVPVQYTFNQTLHYCPMLVSVKNRLSYSENQRDAAIAAMKEVLEDAGIETGVCMLLLIGLEDPSTQPSTQPSNFRFCRGTVSAVEINVPKEDDFGASNIALCSTCAGGEQSEVMECHADLALLAQGDSTGLLRSKTTEDDPSHKLLTEIANGYDDVITRLSDEK